MSKMLDPMGATRKMEDHYLSRVQRRKDLEKHEMRQRRQRAVNVVSGNFDHFGFIPIEKSLKDIELEYIMAKSNLDRYEKILAKKILEQADIKKAA